MGVATKTGLWLKSTRVIKNNPKFREFLKNLGIVISKRVYPNGVTKDIRKAGKFRLSSDFVFLILRTGEKVIITSSRSCWDWREGGMLFLISALT